MGSWNAPPGTGVSVWDAAVGRREAILHEVENAGAVSFSPDGRWGGHGRRRCQVWEVGTWKRGLKLEYGQGMGFSPDGALSPSSTTIRSASLSRRAVGNSPAWRTRTWTGPTIRPSAPMVPSSSSPPASVGCCMSGICGGYGRAWKRWGSTGTGLPIHPPIRRRMRALRQSSPSTSSGMIRLHSSGYEPNSTLDRP